MKRFLAGFLVVAALSAASLPAAAADRPVKLTLDGRPVDRQGGIAVLRGGVISADIVDLVKSFDGLLTFQGRAVVVSIGGTVARFTIGSRTVKIGQGAVPMRGPAFLRHGDVYVPLETFVTRVAAAKLRVDPSRTKADILVNANP